jgi:hypothetical protein
MTAPYRSAIGSTIGLTDVFSATMMSSHEPSSDLQSLGFAEMAQTLFAPRRIDGLRREVDGLATHWCHRRSLSISSLRFRAA